MEKLKLVKITNFTFFHSVFYGICILKSFNSHISVVVCSFFEFGMPQNGVLGNGLNNTEGKGSENNVIISTIIISSICESFYFFNLFYFATIATIISSSTTTAKGLIDWLNGVLRHFQQYFSHITATAHIIHVFPGFHQ